VRREPGSSEPLAHVRLRTGRELDVVDVSNNGALVEGSARLLPGTHADVHVTAREGRRLVRARIVRAYVCQLSNDAVRYRGALAFEHPVDTEPTGYALPEVLRDPIGAEGSTYPIADAASGEGSGDARES
jgi:hypothetical protein